MNGPARPKVVEWSHYPSIYDLQKQAVLELSPEEASTLKALRIIERLRIEVELEREETKKAREWVYRLQAELREAQRQLVEAQTAHGLEKQERESEAEKQRVAMFRDLLLGGMPLEEATWRAEAYAKALKGVPT